MLANVVPLSERLDSFSKDEILCRSQHQPMGVVICSIIYCIEQPTLPMVYLVCLNDPRKKTNRQRERPIININFRYFYLLKSELNDFFGKLHTFVVCVFLIFFRQKWNNNVKLCL